MRIVCIAIISVLTAVAQVSPPHVIVVEGSVAKPGVYPIPYTGQLPTVTTAIAQAGGLIQYADHRAFIIRVDDQGLTHTIAVQLWDIMNRKKPDISLQPGDILQVPDSPKRRLLQDPHRTPNNDTPNMLPITNRPAA